MLSSVFCRSIFGARRNVGMSDFYIASVPPLDSIGDKNAMNEEYKKLRYCIEYRSSEISDEEVIPLIKEGN